MLAVKSGGYSLQLTTETFSKGFVFICWAIASKIVMMVN